MTVKAPYHFVPLSKWVLLPDWAHKVSHDIPFKDGLCGTIEFTLTNASPLLVGDQKESQDDESTLVKWARDPEGEPLIPGSSIKGMLRSVMEIATFSKMSQVENKHFSYRDISSSNNDYSNSIKGNVIKAAWLKFDFKTDKWKVRYAEHIEVFDDEFNTYAGTNIENTSLDNSNQEIPINQRKVLKTQSSIDKYKQYPLDNHPINFTIVDRDIKGTKGKFVIVPRALNFNVENQYDKSGYPVFLNERLGDVEYRIDRLAYSYIFYNEDSIEKEIDTDLINKFFNSHDTDTINHIKTYPQPDLGIPVFLRVNLQKNQINHIGLSKLPRIQFKHSIKQILDKQQISQTSIASYDFTETLFGTIKNFGLSLKSRVSFEDLSVQNFKQHHLTISEDVTLSTPKASYVNSYLEQPNAMDSGLLTQNDFNNYNSLNSKLSGWKRYPASNKSMHSRLAIPENENTNKKVTSKLEGLKPNSQFNGKLHFHNLKEEELGALIWGLTLGNLNSGNSNYHSLGHGKSLGFGVVQIKCSQLFVETNNGNKGKEMMEYLNTFIGYMEEEHLGEAIKDSWITSPQIKHLLQFSKFNSNSNNNEVTQRLKYMNLGEHKNTKESQNRKVLKKWQGFERAEIKEMDMQFLNKYNFKRIGLGRLSHMTEMAKIDEEIIDTRTEEEKQLNKPECLKHWEKIVKDLNSTTNIFGQNNAIETFIDDAIDKGNYDLECINQLLSLIRKVKICGFLKKPNKKKIEKYNSKKAKIEKLKQIYNITC